MGNAESHWGPTKPTGTGTVPVTVPTFARQRSLRGMSDISIHPEMAQADLDSILVDGFGAKIDEMRGSRIDSCTHRSRCNIRRRGSRHEGPESRVTTDVTNAQRFHDEEG